ncbi:MAG: restriction endonuclease subunit S, partial [Patescibacteria group bacterium]
MQKNNQTKFKETEIGTIPEEWEIISIGNILSLEYGKALKDENRIVGEIPVYGSNGVVGFHNQKLVDGPGIIVGRKGSAGEVIFSKKDFFPIDTTYFVKTNFDTKYVYYLLKNTDIKQLVSSSAVPGLNRNDVYSQQIEIPKS